ncbi:hypothetical protein AB0M10_15715 [Streptomyces sp. NPDC051840]|uniref:hypothetical protein n=1 Tax=Streptomyces sp. NPDC051840 TaxID=3154752 RepID=UPI0034215860
MSYAPNRSLTGEINEGLTDGSYKKVVRDRGGQVDPATNAAREDLNDLWYGIHETPYKAAPGGRVVSTPNYVPTRPPHLFLGL